MHARLAATLATLRAANPDEHEDGPFVEPPATAECRALIAQRLRTPIPTEVACFLEHTSRIAAVDAHLDFEADGFADARDLGLSSPCTSEIRRRTSSWVTRPSAPRLCTTSLVAHPFLAPRFSATFLRLEVRGRVRRRNGDADVRCTGGGAVAVTPNVATVVRTSNTLCVQTGTPLMNALGTHDCTNVTVTLVCAGTTLYEHAPIDACSCQG